MQYAQAVLEPDHGDRDLLRLPEPTTVDRSFDDVLRSRRSRRTMAGEGLSLDQLSTLLHYGAGVTGESDLGEGEGPTVSKPFRSYPSAGGLYPVETYVAVVNEGDGLDRGLYYYVPERHGLRVLRTGDVTEAVADAFSISADVHDPSQASVVCFLTAALWRSMAKYGPRGYRFVLQESGHLAQNLTLAAEALSLATVPLGGFYDDAVTDLVGANGVDEVALYPVSVGHLGGDEE
jgi:SagB-type dehydrogenase family enzyme